MKAKVVSVLLCMAMVTTMAVGCGSSSDSSESTDSSKKESTEAEGGDAEETGEQTLFQQAEAQVDEDLAPLPDKDSGKKLAAIESTLSNSFWVTMQEGYEDAAEEYGVSIDIQATDSDTDTAGQLDILNNMLVQDYDAIAVSPLTEDCLISGIVSANQQGVTVITTGNEVNEEALEEAEESLAMVKQSIEDGMPEDFFSIDLMAAYGSLGKITGEEVGEDLVNEIFSKFCMGK